MAWFFIVAVLLLVCLTAVYLKTSADNTLEKMGIAVSPGAVPLLGHAYHQFRHGMAKSQVILYNIFKDTKVYGVYNFRQPAVYVRDPKMVKNICIKYFNSFVDRPHFGGYTGPLHDNLSALKGEHWKRVRQTLSPMFSTSRVKKMSKLVEKNAKQLVENLRQVQERNQEIELTDFLSCFSLDVIVTVILGIEMNTMKNPTNPTALQMKRALTYNSVLSLLLYMCPKLTPLFEKLNIHVFNQDALFYCTNIADKILAEREKDGQMGKFKDFLDHLSVAEHGEGTAASKLLTRSELHCEYSEMYYQGTILIFLLAGHNTTLSNMSSILFLLTMHPECLKKVQAEIDEKIGHDTLNYDNVNQLTYLQMRINEKFRLLPPGIRFERQCTEDVVVDGIRFPKGTHVLFPVYSMHHDPDLWPEPEKFRPERFSPEEKDSINPYAFFDFGHGPRNCIGMSFAKSILKISLVSILQQFTPVSCSKTVYPPTLCGPDIKPKDGLWVKMEARK